MYKNTFLRILHVQEHFFKDTACTLYKNTFLRILHVQDHFFKDTACTLYKNTIFKNGNAVVVGPKLEARI